MDGVQGLGVQHQEQVATERSLSPPVDVVDLVTQAGAQATGLAVAAPPVFTPSLKVVLSTAFGALALLAAVISSAAIGRVADKRIRADIGAEFTSAAENVATLLDRGLFERLRDVQVAASLDTMIDTNGHLARPR